MNKFFYIALRLHYLCLINKADSIEDFTHMMKEEKNLSRRTALKNIGLGAAGTLGAVYGVSKLTTNNTADTEIANQSVAVPVPDNIPMKVLLINGSPKSRGNTFICLSEIADILQAEGIQTHIIHIGVKAIQGCTACNSCNESGECAFTDATYLEIRQHLSESDGFIVGSPVYFSGPTGSLCAMLDRIFYTTGASLLHNKAAAAITVCRRSGGTATLDRLHKYFSYARMQIIASQYWNIAHGAAPGEVREDKEGLQIMRTLARNMAWNIRNTRLAKQAPPIKEEPSERTNFIR